VSAQRAVWEAVGNLLELQLFFLPGLSWFISATVLSQVQHIKKIDEWFRKKFLSQPII
jgi:hypothetical protein